MRRAAGPIADPGRRRGVRAGLGARAVDRRTCTRHSQTVRWPIVQGPMCEWHLSGESRWGVSIGPRTTKGQSERSRATRRTPAATGPSRRDEPRRTSPPPRGDQGRTRDTRAPARPGDRSKRAAACRRAHLSLSSWRAGRPPTADATVAAPSGPRPLPLPAAAEARVRGARSGRPRRRLRSPAEVRSALDWQHPSFRSRPIIASAHRPLCHHGMARGR